MRVWYDWSGCWEDWHFPTPVHHHRVATHRRLIMDALHYRLVAIGIAFIAINISIDGMQLILPTCVGFGLLAFASWNLRDISPRHYIPAFGLAIGLAFLSFPDLFRDAVHRDGSSGEAHGLYWFDVLTFYPYTIASIALLVLIAHAIAGEAKRDGKVGLYRFALISAGAVVVFELPRFAMPFDSRAMLWLFFIITSAYSVMMIVCATWAARRLS